MYTLQELYDKVGKKFPFYVMFYDKPYIILEYKDHYWYHNMKDNIHIGYFSGDNQHFILDKRQIFKDDLANLLSDKPINKENKMTRITYKTLDNGEVVNRKSIAFNNTTYSVVINNDNTFDILSNGMVIYTSEATTLAQAKLAVRKHLISLGLFSVSEKNVLAA